MMNTIIFNKKGFSLVEALVMMFVASVCIFVVWKVYTLYIKVSLANPALFQASFLAEEGIEAIKFMRDTKWDNIATLTLDTDYTLVFTGTAWATTTNTIWIDNKFDRRVRVSAVYRDTSGNITTSGTLDTNTKKVVATVSWKKDSATTTRQITTYVNNIFTN